MWGKLLSGIKGMYVNSLACVRLKGGESERFRIDSGVKKRSNPSRQHLKVLHRWGVRRRGKAGKKRKSRSKVVGFRSTSLFPARKLETVTEGGAI